MSQVPNGFYKVEANGLLDIPASDTTVVDPSTGDIDWQCNLVVKTAENGNGATVDQWETEAWDHYDATFFLKAAVNVFSSDGVAAFRVDCLNQNSLTWSSSSLKIIAVDASDLIQQNGF